MCTAQDLTDVIAADRLTRGRTIMRHSVGTLDRQWYVAGRSHQVTAKKPFAAQILARNGVVAVVSAVSPYRATRDAIRAEIDAFVEIYLCTPKETCVDRDTNGMWADALSGKIRGFTGVETKNPRFNFSQGVVRRYQMPAFCINHSVAHSAASPA